ncbi:MAG: SRPBCC domain-containing protein [Actinomycetota bacterium]|nr:SRPBCC domain-containing protein [Actinomycetota bacterium]
MTDNTSSQNAMVIERRLDGPVDLIWQMWTEPRHFKAWYGPGGATIPVAKMDVRVGGTRVVCMEMQTPNGPRQMWFTGEYVEVVQNERLVYTESMSDENGNVLSPADLGMPEGHPTTTEVRVELENVGGRTKMVITHIGIPGDSPGAAGWAMALDKLATRVGQMTADQT